jgi:Glyceraldehyde 3-phosphate dehydrogenase, NAD binding domain
MTVRVGINGFGRTGRAFTRLALDRADLQVVAVNDITDAGTLAHLLAFDSTYGRLGRPVEHTDDALIVAGHAIPVLFERDPAAIDWARLGADVVVESTGKFRTRDGAALHLKGGARKVLISAPGKGADLTVVLGVNQGAYDPARHDVISNASCTTNCVAPMVKVLHDAVRWPAHEGTPALAKRLVDVIDLERALVVGAALDRGAPPVLMTMVPATTAKTGSTVGPEAVANAIRPMPPAAIGRRHAAGMSVLITGGPARWPDPSGTCAPPPSSIAGVVCRAAASLRSRAPFGLAGPSWISLQVFQVPQAYPGAGGHLRLAQVEFRATSRHSLAQVAGTGRRRPRPSLELPRPLWLQAG